MSDYAKRVEAAVEIALECGSFDGSHHKMWVIDQMLRALDWDSLTVEEIRAAAQLLERMGALEEKL